MNGRDEHKISSEALQGIAQWVFKATLADLRERLESSGRASDRYQMLGIAPLLRKLLLDGDKLVDYVNRRYRLPIRFCIAPFDLSDLDCYQIMQSRTAFPLPPMQKLGYWRLFYPGALMRGEDEGGLSLGLPHFLQTHVGVVNRYRVSVKDLIQFYCIVEGGVHFGQPRKKFEKDLLELVPHELCMPDEGIDNSPIGTLFACAEIVSLGLQPLLDATEDDPVLLKPNTNLMVSSTGIPRHRKGGGAARN